MRIYTYCLFSIYIGLCAFNAPQLKAQTVNAVQNQNNVTINISDLPAISNKTNSPYPAHFRAFIVFGDGNYLRSNTWIPPQTTTQYSFTHTYLNAPGQPNSFNYNPIILLYERKTDDPPPVANPVIPTPNTISVSSQNPITYTDFIDYPTPIINIDTNGCRRVGLDHSHFLHDTSWSSAIVAYRPIEGGKLLFYFEDDNGDPRKIFEETTTVSYGSSYGGITTDGNLVNHQIATTTYENSTVDMTKPYYQEVLIYDIPAIELGIDKVAGTDTAEELRLFHFLKTFDISEGTNYSFMIIQATSDLSVANSLDSCISSNYNEDSLYTSNYVSNINGNLRVGKSTLYYYDADTIQLKTGDPEDPNQLTVIDICKCGPNRDIFQISFNLRICNISPFPAESASIYITDHSNEYYCFKEISGSPTYNMNPARCTSDATVCNNRGYSPGFDKQFCIEGFSIAKSPSQETENDHCVYFNFTANTNSNGLQAIQKREIESCVYLHKTECEFVCVRNDTLNLDRPKHKVMWRQKEEVCQKKCNTCVPPCPRWPIIILALIIIGVIFRKNILRLFKKTEN